MKKILFLTALFVIALAGQMFTTSPTPVHAKNSSSESSADKGLCLPGDSEFFSVQDCLIAGPAERLQELEEMGITFPAIPLYASTIPVEMGIVPFTYARVVNEEVPLYGSKEDIEAEKPNGKLPAGRIKYVSLYYTVETSKGVYYQIGNEKWISKAVVSRVGTQSFEGFLFKENPTSTFGWVLDHIVSRRGPSINAPETGKTYERFDLVNVYGSQMENETEWVMIGPNEWVDHNRLSRIIPSTEKPAGVDSDRWIEINLYEQVLLVHEGDQIVFATLVSTGVDPFFTQPGVFTIYEKIDHEYMRGAFEADRSDYYYLEDVPFIMYYDQSRALHGAYWHTWFGLQQSHGCVNLSIADARWLYEWANVGDYVYVWDPSGETPTDPSLYGAGGV